MNNLVENGDFKYFRICVSKDSGALSLENDHHSVELSRNTISKCEVIHTEYGKNIIDIIARIIIGVYIAGPLGLIAGFTASNSYEKYRLVSVEFSDEKKSTIKMNKRYYKKLIEVIM